MPFQSGRALRWSGHVSEGQGGDSSTGLSSFQDRLRESALRFLKSIAGLGEHNAVNLLGQFAACLAFPPLVGSAGRMQKLRLK